MCARAWEESVTCQVCCRESFHCGPARTCLPTLWKCQDPASWQLVPRALCYLSSLKAPGFNFELFLCQGPAGPLEMKTDPCSRGAPPPVWGVWHTTRSPPQTRQSGRVQRAGLQGENAVWWWNQVLQMEEGTGLHFALTDERILTGGGVDTHERHRLKAQGLLSSLEVGYRDRRGGDHKVRWRQRLVRIRIPAPGAAFRACW